MGLLVCWWSEIASLDGGDVPGGDLMLDVGIRKGEGKWIKVKCLLLETLKVSGQGDGIWQIVRLLVKLMSCVLCQVSRSTGDISWLLVKS